MSGVLGIHHVTAISTDPQRTVDFYTGVLGLRLVKRTVNFDDTGTYHLYFGDEAGSPGTLMTFFPWPRGARGRQGVGQVAVTSFSIPPAALGYWLERFVRLGIRHEGPVRREPSGGVVERAITFSDPDGLLLELVAHEAVDAEQVSGTVADVPPEHGVRGIHAVSIWVKDAADTERVLTETLGFAFMHEDGMTRRFTALDGLPGTLVDVRTVGGFLDAAEGTGTVHHVAWRVPDEQAELALRERVAADGLRPTRVMDRHYFRSVYFREPGGVLFELATDPPGFTIDEPLDSLGARLMLPPRYEPDRGSIEGSLPPLSLHEKWSPLGAD